MVLLYRDGAALNIVFEFIGGPYDGRILNGTLGEASDAERHFLFSNRGTVGYRFKVISDYAVEALSEEPTRTEQYYQFQQHHYLVVDHMENEDTVKVLAKYDHA